MDIVERLAQQAAETINGGEFYDGKWYTEGQRQAWRKAMTPAATEIEWLREENAKLKEEVDDLNNRLIEAAEMADL
jgi:ubiquinone biosynthesis protein UbiJ